MRTATTFFTLLTLAAAAATIGIVALAATGRRDWLRRTLTPQALWLAWLVALVATAGSLYYSEVVGFPPCELCWYQRIAVYPLAVVLLVAARHGDAGVRRYVWPLSALGSAVAAYHYQLEWFPAQAQVVCSTDVPCSVAWFRGFGFVSLPLMAFVTLATVSALLWVAALAGDAPGAGDAPASGDDADDTTAARDDADATTVARDDADGTTVARDDARPPSAAPDDARRAR